MPAQSGANLNLVFGIPPAQAVAGRIDLQFIPNSQFLLGHTEDATAVFGFQGIYPDELSGTTADAAGNAWVLHAPPHALAGVTEDSSGHFLVGMSFIADLLATTEDPAYDFTAIYDVNVFRGPSTEAYLRFADGAGVTLETRGPWSEMPVVAKDLQEKWEGREQVSQDTQFLWSFPTPTVADFRETYGEGSAHTAETLLVWSFPDVQILSSRLPWGPAELRQIHIELPFRYPPFMRKNWEVAWDKKPKQYQVQYTVDWNSATVTNLPDTALAWNDGTPSTWVFGWPVERVPITPPLRSPNLIFLCPSRGKNLRYPLNLVFGNQACPWMAPVIEPIVIGSEGALLVENTTSVRLMDGTVVDAVSVSIQLDQDAWAWGFSMELEGPQALDAITPVTGDPVAININVNGYVWIALVEEYGKQELFGRVRYTASGRSQAAVFAAPYSPVRTYQEGESKNAKQLIEQELVRAGAIPKGFSANEAGGVWTVTPNVTWSVSYHANAVHSISALMDDWIVPPDHFSYENKSAIEAMNQVAGVIGARVVGHMHKPLFEVLPRYPYSAWEWAGATPEVTIEPTVITDISTRLEPKLKFTQVLVTGQTDAGYTLLATRSGAVAPHIVAPMVSDPLFTTVAAARERARTILSDVGKQAKVSITIPLSQQTPLVEPGTLIAVDMAGGWRGLVVSVSVSATYSEATQTIEIERHF